MEKKLRKLKIPGIIKQRRKALIGKKNVVGVGRGIRLDQDVITVFVRKKVPLVDLKIDDVVPYEIDGYKTNVIEIGDVIAHDELDNQDRKRMWRPAPAGVSISHYKVTAGTFGCIVRDKTGKRLILSNNHILANENNTLINDPIFQPGTHDGGTNEHLIAKLEKYVPLVFENDDSPPPPTGPSEGICPFANFAKKTLQFVIWPVNFLARFFNSRYRVEFQLSKMQTDDYFKQIELINVVDAAVACPIDDRMILDMMLDGPVIYDTISEPEVGLQVSKSGRTTGLTHGEVIAVGATILVYYGNNKRCLFENQIITTYMSELGDSGSLVWSGNKAVGLLFAGSSQVTICNPINEVLSVLNVTLQKT